MSRIVTVAAIALLLLAGCNGDDPSDQPAPDAASVVVQSSAFQPQTLTVSAGTTVRWDNADGFGHTATSGEPGSPAGIFDVDLPANGSGEHTFDAPGTFPYYCAIHPSMTAEVVVE